MIKHKRKLSTFTAFKTLLPLLLTLLLTVKGAQGRQPSGSMNRQTENNNPESSFTNHLRGEKSPYLLQHLHNPVDWYPWGDEAFAKALAEDKPIFLSIGYATCHWCHVMAHESFEDPEVAAFLNKHFISIKVDREERPDVDRLYMAATQAMTGSGGWPMSAFLLGNGKPFYTGTYFPPRSSHGRPGFLDLLHNIEKAWRTERGSLQSSAAQVMNVIDDSGVDTGSPADHGWIKNGFTQIQQSYEPKYGGFSQSPKFPRPVVLDFLFHYYRTSGDKEARDMALHTLDEMARGGIYDHLGGGFHRYSVDGRWQVPHFEKMLYDQAQLVWSYLAGFQLTRNPAYEKTVRETLDYILREMVHPQGGFYSAQDADSADPYDPQKFSEGAYYLWQEEEIDRLLDGKSLSGFKTHYNISRKGNVLHDPHGEFGDRNIIHVPGDLVQTARKTGTGEDELMQQLAEARTTLLDQRNSRVPPLLDDKIITSWNGLMISAMARAGKILGQEQYLRAAERSVDFILNNLMAGDKLKRRWRQGEARHEATLDDYAFFIQGLLDLYRAGHDPRHLDTAVRLMEQQISDFSDPRGGFFDTPSSSKLLTRMRASYDGAEPSGNSVSAVNLIRLGHLTGNNEWLELGKKTVEAFGKLLERASGAMPFMLRALLESQVEPLRIIIIGDEKKSDTRDLLGEVHRSYLPGSLLLVVDPDAPLTPYTSHLPYLKEMKPIDNRATAYLCENYICKNPVTSVQELREQLNQRQQTMTAERKE